MNKEELSKDDFAIDTINDIILERDSYKEECEARNQEKEQLIKYLEDKIEKCHKNHDKLKTMKLIEQNAAIRIVYQEILEKVRSGKYE